MKAKVLTYENQGGKKYHWRKLPILLLVGLLFSLSVIYQVRAIGAFPMDRVMESLALVMLLFMAILIFRYIFFLGLSYLHIIFYKQPSKNSYQYRFSVLVPAYNEGKLIDQSIASLLQLDYPNYEIIVINDGSTDDTYRRVKKWEGHYGKTQVRVFSKEQGGKSQALNYGIKMATGELLFCMDGDSKLSPQTLTKMAQHFQDEEVGAVAGSVSVANANNFLTKLQDLEYLLGLNFCRRAEGYIGAVDTVPGPCGAFRKKALEEVGGYDNDTYAEDCDVTLKILRHGWKVLYEPEALAITEAPEGVLNLFKQRYRWTRGKLQSINKHRSSLCHPISDPLNFFVSWYLVFESAIWPFMNIVANLYFLYVGWMYGLTTLLLFWWVQWGLLDIATALYCVSMDEKRLRLVPFAFIYRISYVCLVDICKVLATVEELFGLRMDWGKLERQGKLEV